MSSAGAGIARIFGRKVVQKKAIDVARKVLANKAITQGETKLLRETYGVIAGAGGRNVGLRTASKAIRRAGQEQGAALGAAVYNIGASTGEIYEEQLEQGTTDRLTALGAAVPHAILNVLPEVGLVRLITGKSLIHRIPSTRVFRGSAIGGGALLEGGTEAAQEAISMAAAGNLDDEQLGHRLLESFAAGATIGALFGGAGSLRNAGRDPANILDPKESAEPTKRGLGGIESPSPGIIDEAPAAGLGTMFRETEETPDLGETFRDEEQGDIENAVQEPSATSVDVREQTEDGRGLGVGDTAGELPERKKSRKDKMKKDKMHKDYKEKAFRKSSKRKPKSRKKPRQR